MVLASDLGPADDAADTVEVRAARQEGVHGERIFVEHVNDAVHGVLVLATEDSVSIDSVTEGQSETDNVVQGDRHVSSFQELWVSKDTRGHEMGQYTNPYNKYTRGLGFSHIF